MIDIKKIKIEVSNRHVHLSKEHIELLFGEGYKLKKHKDLSQIGQFAAHEKVNIAHKDKKIENVRVVGPARDQTQVEISRTDSMHLNLNAPLKLSGDLEESKGITIIGPKNSIQLDKGTIIAHRHLHLSDIEAKELGLSHGQSVSIKVLGEKEIIFEKIIVRTGPDHRLALHIDSDEGKECLYTKETFGELIIEEYGEGL